MSKENNNPRKSEYLELMKEMQRKDQEIRNNPNPYNSEARMVNLVFNLVSKTHHCILHLFISKKTFRSELASATG